MQSGETKDRGRRDVDAVCVSHTSRRLWKRPRQIPEETRSASGYSAGTPPGGWNCEGNTALVPLAAEIHFHQKSREDGFTELGPTDVNVYDYEGLDHVHHVNQSMR
jgi:hypothetical protein